MKTQESWIVQNWFKLGILIILLIVALSFYNFSHQRKLVPEEPSPLIQQVEQALSIPTKKVELTENRSYLFDSAFNPNNIKLYGVALGDDISRIDPATITEHHEEYGWVHTVNNVGYRVSSGKVVEFIISTKELERAGFRRENEILIRFGEPDKVEKGEGFLAERTQYFYIDRGLIVSHIDLPSGDDIFSVNILGK